MTSSVTLAWSACAPRAGRAALGAICRPLTPAKLLAEPVRKGLRDTERAKGVMCCQARLWWFDAQLVWCSQWWCRFKGVASKPAAHDSHSVWIPRGGRTRQKCVGCRCCYHQQRCCPTRHGCAGRPQLLLHKSPPPIPMTPGPKMKTKKKTHNPVISQSAWAEVRRQGATELLRRVPVALGRHLL